MDALLRRRAMGIPKELEYIQDGLVFWLDGIDKGATDGAWVDLINGYVFTNNGAVSNEDNFYFGGAAGMTNTSFTPPSGSTGTIECVYDYDNAGVVFYPKSTQRLAFWHHRTKGSFETAGSTSLAASGISTGKGQVSARRGLVLSNGVSKTLTTNNNGSTNGTNYIGQRNGGPYFTGKVFCLRMYDRQLSEAEMRHNLAVDNVRFSLGLTL